MENYSNDVLDKIIHLKKVGKRNNEYIQERIIKEFDINIPLDEIKEILKDIKQKKTSIQELNEELDDINNYEIEEDNYVFYVSVTDKETGEKHKKKYSLPISFVDNIFKNYSRYGENKTQQQIIDEFNIEPKAFALLKNRLWLNKRSHVLSNITLERWWEQLEEKIIEVSHTYVDTYKKKFINSIEKKKKKEFDRMAKILANRENQLEHLQEYLKTYKPKKLNFERKEILNNDSVTVWFSDTHIGKNDTEWVIRRIQKMTNIIINRPEKHVNLMFLWDIAETLLEWWYHSGQINEMDWVYGFDLMMQIVEVFEMMLIELYKAWKEVSFTWIGWNHWRSTKEPWDWQRTNALTIFELIKRWVKSIGVEVKYLRDSINSITLWDYHYIVSHWDNNFAKKAKTKPEEILWKNWDKEKENLILFWHLHSTYVAETDKWSIIGLPWLAWVWAYDKRLDLKSSAWMVIIEKGDDGLPNILITRLK